MSRRQGRIPETDMSLIKTMSEYLLAILVVEKKTYSSI